MDKKEEEKPDDAQIEEAKKDENEEKDEKKDEPEEKKMIQRVGQILNEDGEWVEYIEEEEADKPPIAYTYMGSAGLEIEDDSEVVDFCM